ncbi:MAG TPA: acylphosphatase [Allosphingosinicella sp.]
MRTTTKRLWIRGRVQGVFYRGWAVEAARELDLGGWVRNRSDGTVEILVAGREADVGRLIDRCRKGPPSARVDGVEVEATDEPVPGRFEKRPTL